MGEAERTPKMRSMPEMVSCHAGAPGADNGSRQNKHIGNRTEPWLICYVQIGCGLTCTEAVVVD